jgi:hypothetical protein
MVHFNVNQNTTNTSDNGSNGKKKFPATPHPSKKHRIDGSTKENGFPALPAASQSDSVSLAFRMNIMSLVEFRPLTTVCSFVAAAAANDTHTGNRLDRRRQGPTR